MSSKKSLSVFSMVLILIPIFALAIFFRLYNIGKTALEVDEPINFALAKSFVVYGYPSTKPPETAPRQPSLFQPLFGYQLSAAWFKLAGNMTIVDARVQNAAASIVVLFLVFLFALKKGKGTALLAAFFIALDGWIITINRMDYLENFQLILIVLAMWAFWSAVKNGDKQLWRWVLAGLMIGFAFIFKHIGVFLVLVVFANWLLTRKDHKGYLVSLFTMGVVGIVYVAAMYLTYGHLYIEAQMVEFDRLFGFTAARGLNFGLSTIISTIVERYWIYITTVVALVIGWPLAAFRYIQALIKRSTAPYDTVVISWTVGAAAFAVASQLKAPHYMILWLVPLFLFLAGEVASWLKGRRLMNTWILVILFLAASIFTWNIRFMVDYGDSLRDSAAYINANIPANAQVSTESYLGEMINQPFSNIETSYPVGHMESDDYLAIYTSSTASIDQLPTVVQKWQQYCLPLATFKGFKDQVMVCKIDHTALETIKP
ncbi:MAG: glycosyltransferase family 39 protein [Candidatus Microgenomates bacterium]|jgi:4-amino-4-deoxy-L-arabinose transferase-like glycosyltransferase